jgi:protein-S-isoprenylcysteine O-methyltransferase Ste14
MPRRSFVAAVLARVPLAALFTLIAVANVLAAFGDGTGSLLHHLLSAVLWSLFAVMVVIRPVPIHRSGSLVGAAVAIGAQLAFLLAGAIAGETGSGPAVAIGNVLLVAGLVFSVVSVAVLGRCFGVLPDVRGLVTRGPYRLVRHPLYLGELVALLGIVIGADRWWLALPVWMAGLVLQLLRTGYEERSLRTVFPEYGDYAAHTKRLIPGVV